MKSLAIIPARSGSKGLKDKNIRSFAGKPLLAYTVLAAKESQCFDEIMVSTDSKKYAAIAKEYGASVPFLRSAHASSDEASSWDMVEEVLEGYSKLDRRFDCFCLLQPTSPLRKAEHIKKAFDVMSLKQAKAIVSVTEADHSLALYNTLPFDGSMSNFVNQNNGLRRRQDYKDIYFRINGAVYLIDVPFFKRSHNIYRDGCYAFEMDKLASIDIDDKDDFVLAELAYMHKEFDDVSSFLTTNTIGG